MACRAASGACHGGRAGPRPAPSRPGCHRATALKRSRSWPPIPRAEARRPAPGTQNPPAIPAQQDQAAAPAFDREIVLLAIVVILGTAMTVLDLTIINVAIPTLGRELGTSIATIQWVLAGYMLAFASVIPPCRAGRLPGSAPGRSGSPHSQRSCSARSSPVSPGRPARRAQRGAAICRALTVRDSQGSGLVAVGEILVVAHDGPAGARLNVHRFTSTNHRALSGNARAGSVAALQLWAVGSVLVSFTPVRGRSPATAGPTSALAGTLAAGGERWCAVLESV